MRSLVVLALGLFSLCLKAQSKIQPNYLIVLSLDGFRWDYPVLYHTPNLDSMAGAGVKAEGLIPGFPSKTFPNHYSIITGLYPDHHGIINNTFHHRATDSEYAVGNRMAVENPIYYSGEPAWVTARKQGIKTASYFFVGSETPVQGIQPDTWKRYGNDVPFPARIDSVVDWLKKPLPQRPRFITFYSDQPDHVGHSHGPVSLQTGQMVEELDSLVGVLFDKLRQLPIADSVNVIVLSDHGMATVSKERSVVIGSLVEDSMLEYCLGSNPFYLVQPRKEYADRVYHVLASQEGLWVWRKNEIPQELNYGTNSSISDLVVCAKPTWSVYQNATQVTDGGTHGYTPDWMDMHAVFYATGPDFKQGYVTSRFRNIEIYNLICRLLGLDAAPNDGNFENVKNMLRNKK
ncbi:MAG: ectonucleotide pyrophosphatase/phosphodiesterase [Breznakibacter sp.]